MRDVGGQELQYVQGEVEEYLQDKIEEYFQEVEEYLQGKVEEKYLQWEEEKYFQAGEVEEYLPGEVEENYLQGEEVEEKETLMEAKQELGLSEDGGLTQSQVDQLSVPLFPLQQHLHLSFFQNSFLLSGHSLSSPTFFPPLLPPFLPSSFVKHSPGFSVLLPPLFMSPYHPQTILMLSKNHHNLISPVHENVSPQQSCLSARPPPDPPLPR